MLKRSVASAIVAVVLAATAVAGPLEDGHAAYNRRDYAMALQLYRLAAALGDERAAFYVRNLEQLIATEERCSHYGQAPGDTEDAGLAHSCGDFATALRIWRPLAEQGDAKAQLALSHMYAEGEGLPQDDAEAIKWLRLAADQGLAEAETRLGDRYRFGVGVSQDWANALSWYRKAAAQSYGPAQSSLGFAYLFGRGVPEDYVLAHMWFNLAAASGNAGAAKSRESVAEQMTRGQIAEAQRMAREWKPGPPP